MLKISKKYKRLIAIVILFSMVILVFEIIPRFFSLSEKSLEYITSKYKISSTEDYDLKIEMKTMENSLLQKKITSVVSDYEESQKISSIFKVLDLQAKKADLIINSIAPMQLEKKNNLWLLPIKVYIKSDFEKIYNLIRFVENTSKVVVFKNMKINTPKTASEGLDVELFMDVYLNI